VADGTLVVPLATGQVCFLTLYHGNQRIDLARLRAIEDASRGR
jgi:hypothetical protein